MKRRRDEIEIEIDIVELVPGGILATDRWHIKTPDGTCSRCRRPLPDDDLPLMFWDESNAENMLIYCERCLALFDAAP